MASAAYLHYVHDERIASARIDELCLQLLHRRGNPVHLRVGGLHDGVVREVEVGRDLGAVHRRERDKPHPSTLTVARHEKSHRDEHGDDRQTMAHGKPKTGPIEALNNPIKTVGESPLKARERTGTGGVDPEMLEVRRQDKFGFDQ